MAKRKDIQKDTQKDTEATANITAAAATPAPDKMTAKDMPLPVDAPAIVSKPQAASEAPDIDISLIWSFIGPEKPAAAAEAPAAASADAEPATTEATVLSVSRWRLPTYAPLAAGIALAVAASVVAGAAVTSALVHDSSTATASVASETRALQATVAQLNSELTALKAGLGNAQRTTTAQMGKLTERLDRAERAQAEPAAKLARLTETVDRLEKRQQQAAALPSPALTAAPAVTAAAPAAALADPDITGTTLAYKEESRPPVAEGWRLRDFYQGRAVVESRNGMLFEVGPGSNLPGLGKVETIKRENGRLVVVAKNGIITAMSEPRRPPGVIPYRY